MPERPPEQGFQGLARELRRVRRERGLTLEALATDTGLTASYLSQIEKGGAVPSISALALIAASLDTDVGLFFPETQEPDVKVTRAGDPERFRIEPNSREEYSLLTARGNESPMSAIQGRHYPGGPVLEFSHVGEEFVLVLAGSIRIVAGDEERVVGPGEWLHYSAQASHSVEVASETRAETLWIHAPALL
jgi:transcriptional regulator with XRE-family HTH domain